VKPVSGKRMLQVLKKLGWALDHVRGSHHYLGKGGRSPLICVPVHGNKTLRPGTQKSIMKAASLSDDDL
jgi:predicted RNA binding protein YcfA (HicA-like mRNA interferase family)